MIENNSLLKASSTPVALEPRESEGELHTNSQRRLKKMAQDFPFDPPSQREIDEKIRNVKKTYSIQPKEETEATDMPKPIRETKLCSTQTEQSPITETHEHSYRMNVIPASRLSSHNVLKLSKLDEVSRVDKSHSFKQGFKPDQFKYEQLERDKSKHPLKYKVMCEELGYDEKDVYKFKQGEKERIQEEYTKQKGMEYLREGTMNAKISQIKHNIRIRTEQSKSLSRSKSHKVVNPKSHIHQIFGGIPEKKIKVSKSTSKKGLKLKQLTEQ